MNHSRQPQPRPRNAAEFVETYTVPFIVSAWIFLTTCLVVVWGVYGYNAALLACVILYTALLPFESQERSGPQG